MLYPMRWPSRSIERRPEIVEELQKSYPNIIDLTHYETQGLALEGTGSLIFDRAGRQIFMSHSERSSEVVLDDLISQLNALRGGRAEWRKVCFNSVHENGAAVYHTNVILGLTPTTAAIATCTIPDPADSTRVTSALTTAGYQLLELTLE